jgi:anti-sigma regulatory factor (Ser/Thr protein kinase)
MSADIPPRNPPGPGRDPAAVIAGEAVLDQAFDAGSLHSLRVAVLAHAFAAGMQEPRASDVMLAIHELAANAVRHGAGAGTLRIWATRGELCCQVHDEGPARAASRPRAGRAGRRRMPMTLSGTAGWPCQPGHGLWLVRAAADQMSAVTGPDGSRVMAVFARPGGSAAR